MADYRNPKVTTTTSGKAGMSKWIWIAVAAIVALLLLWWLLAAGDETAETGSPPDAVVVEPADPAEPATEPAN
jgi:succinate dehydrogenase hydrophobic anchor subunit